MREGHRCAENTVADWDGRPLIFLSSGWKGRWVGRRSGEPLHSCSRGPVWIFEERGSSSIPQKVVVGHVCAFWGQQWVTGLMRWRSGQLLSGLCLIWNETCQRVQVQATQRATGIRRVGLHSVGIVGWINSLHLTFSTRGIFSRQVSGHNVSCYPICSSANLPDLQK